MKVERFVTKNDKTVNLDDFTILVGPNNSGKSQTLFDIHNYMRNNVQNPNTTIIDSLEYAPLQYEDYKNNINIEEDSSNANQKVVHGISSNLTNDEQQNVNKSHIESFRNEEDITDNQYWQRYLAKFKVALLDASSRLEIAEETNSYDVSDGYPSNILQKLYTSREARRELRSAFNETFDMDILLDYSGLQKFTLRVADGFEEEEDCMLAPPDNYNQYKKIDNQGAGFKSFAGVVLSLLLIKDRIILLDEPEAFLHPAQARQFGAWMAKHVEEIPGQIVISTHNSHFLSGVLSSPDGITIHRLNRVGDYTKYTTMSTQNVVEMASDPLLTNQRIIEGIFHRGVIVCESDSDSLIYRHVSNIKLDDDVDSLFTHAHNKQTISRVTSVLSDASIPCVAVPDIDIFKKPGDVSEIFLSTARDPSDFEEIAGKAKKIQQAVHRNSVEWRTIKSEGVRGFPDEIQDTVSQTIEILRSNGVFVVDVGELESWIDIDKRKGSGWVIKALDVLDEEGPPDNLVQFLQEIHSKLEVQYQDAIEA